MEAVCRSVALLPEEPFFSCILESDAADSGWVAPPPGKAPGKAFFDFQRYIISAAIVMAITTIPPTTPPEIAAGLVWCAPEVLGASAAAVAGIKAAVVEVEAVGETRFVDAEADEWIAEEVDEDDVIWLDDEVIWLDDDALDRNGAALLGFESRNPAVRSPTGQPFCAQGFDLQHPIKGGVVAVHVNQRLPLGHCWSGNWL